MRLCGKLVDNSMVGLRHLVCVWGGPEVKIPHKNYQTYRTNCVVVIYLSNIPPPRPGMFDILFRVVRIFTPDSGGPSEDTTHPAASQRSVCLKKYITTTKKMRSCALRVECVCVTKLLCFLVFPD